MRIALISDFTGWGWAGCEELWAVLAIRALQEGHKVAFFQSRETIDPQKLRPLLEAGLELILPDTGTRIVNYVKKDLSWKLGSLVTSWFPPFTEIRKSSPDVVFITVGSALPSTEFLNNLERSGTLQFPYVVVCHNSYLFDTPIAMKAQERIASFYMGARRVLFVAERTYKETEHLLAISLAHTIVVRNPVNMRDSSLIPMPGGITVRIASIGRLTMRSKGQDILLAALGSPRFKDRDWTLSIYGDGPHLRNLKLLAKHYQLADRVEFKGYANDVRAIWADNHILVLPSRNESAPLVLTEAMLCGRPSVVNDVGGIREWVSEPETAFISEGINIESFRSALDRAWSARDDWEQMGLRARAKALQLLDPDPGQTVLRILLEVVAQSRSDA